jgi:hypothetical protein
MILALVLACGTEKEADERNVAPIGNPFPMDMDDTVIDNPDLIPGNLSGTIELTANLPLMGATCDSTYTLKGTPYTGTCPGCTFNFQVVSQSTRNDGVDCPAPADVPGWGTAAFSQATFQLWLWQYNVVFQYSSYWTGTGWYYGTVSNDPALAWGVDYYQDPLVWPIAYKGSYFGTITNVTDHTIDWTFDWTYKDLYYGTGLQEIHAVGYAFIVQ